MKVAVFSAKPYEKRFFLEANQKHGLDLVFLEPHLTPQTIALARGFEVVCIFVNDTVRSSMMAELAREGVRLLALRSAGFNHVDLAAAERFGITVKRVPAYSPFAVAEHTLALLLALNRKVHRAYARVREGNFLLDGLMGFELRDKTVGIVGTGNIGTVVAEMLHGFRCRLLGFDVMPNPKCTAFGLTYVTLPELFEQSDIITLHCPLTPSTHHMINAQSIRQMKQGVILLNTSRGALIDTKAIVSALKRGKLGYLGLDTYEEEADLFFEDLSERVIQDDVFARLLTFPNVLITGHQAFFTENALRGIAETTLENIRSFAAGDRLTNVVTTEAVSRGGSEPEKKGENEARLSAEDRPGGGRSAGA